MKKVVIVGAGFGGLAAALALEKLKIPGLKIVLVSDKPHFEYTPALYRVVTGKTPLEVCIPIAEILTDKKIEFNRDKITEVHPEEKVVVGESGPPAGRAGSRYSFDYLVLALGSETAYFDVPGLRDFSFGFKSITEALRLKKHIHEAFRLCAVSPDDEEDDICRMHFVIVGAGSSGTELAGELAVYLKKLAGGHGVDQKMITIDLIEAAGRVLPNFPEKVSQRVARRLKNLGVNIFTNRPVESENTEEIKFLGGSLKTKTVIWTAGVKPNSFYRKINGLEFDKNGRVLVDDYLQARGQKNIFIIGDAAATEYSGMAQTAIADGFLVAKNIGRELVGEPLVLYKSRKPYHSIPVGPGWAATLLNGTAIYGYPGWLLRRAADLRYFFSILPLGKAITAFQSGKKLCESCEICENSSALL